MRTYFAELRTVNDGLLIFVYNSEHRKNTADNHWDLFEQLRAYNRKHGTDIKIDSEYYIRRIYGRYRGAIRYRNDLAESIYILNKRNIEEEGFYGWMYRGRQRGTKAIWLF